MREVSRFEREIALLVADGNRPNALPHPRPASGRNLLVHETGEVLLAQNVRPVTFTEFNNSGPVKHVEGAKSGPTGIHPFGNYPYPYVNAAELIFHVDTKLAEKMGIKEFRCRQKMHSEEVWERELKDGQITPWTKTMSGRERPDDPEELSQTTSLPVIAYYDQPGFMNATGDESQLMGPNEKRTSRLAMLVFLRQNFVGWIDGRGSGGDKKWEQVSDEVKWHSNQSLIRSLFSGLPKWVNAKQGTEIAPGHTHGRPR